MISWTLSSSIPFGLCYVTFFRSSPCDLLAGSPSSLTGARRPLPSFGSSPRFVDARQLRSSPFALRIEGCVFASLLLSALRVLSKPNASVLYTISSLLLQALPFLLNSEQLPSPCSLRGVFISSVFFCVNYRPRTLSNEAFERNLLSLHWLFFPYSNLQRIFRFLGASNLVFCKSSHDCFFLISFQAPLDSSLFLFLDFSLSNFRF